MIDDATEGAENQAGRGLDALRAALQRASTTPEQGMLIELLLGLDNQRAPEVPAARAAEPAAPKSRAAGRMAAELSDLREVNDTMAAALGACGLCWGGDPECSACDGAGRSGHVMPDHDLFQELVIPALRRVCDARRKKRFSIEPQRRRKTAT